MVRRLYKIVAALCLLLSLVVVGLWVRSYYVGERISYGVPMAIPTDNTRRTSSFGYFGQAVWYESSRGEMLFGFRRWANCFGPPFGFTRKAESPDTYYLDSPRGVLGPLRYEYRDRIYSSTTRTTTGTMLAPCWLLLVILLLPVGLWVSLAQTVWKRQRRATWAGKMRHLRIRPAPPQTRRQLPRMRHTRAGANRRPGS